MMYSGRFRRAAVFCRGPAWAVLRWAGSRLRFFKGLVLDIMKTTGKQHRGFIADRRECR
jgi:hypothetical protein